MTRVVTKEMDSLANRSHFESNNLPCFTFSVESQKHIKAVIRHLRFATPAEDISDGLVNLRFDVISVKQISTTRRSRAEGTTTVNFPLLLIALPRTSKSHEMFKLTSLCHIAIRVETNICHDWSHAVLQLPIFRLSWLTASNLIAIYGVGAVTCTRNARRRAIQYRYGHAATANWCTERNHIPPTVEAAGTPRRDAKGKVTESAQDYKRKSVLFHPHDPTAALCSSLSRPRLHRPAPPQWDK
jgi:hypothetical protein